MSDGRVTNDSLPSTIMAQLVPGKHWAKGLVIYVLYDGPLIVTLGKAVVTVDIYGEPINATNSVELPRKSFEQLLLDMRVAELKYLMGEL